MAHIAFLRKDLPKDVGTPKERAAKDAAFYCTEWNFTDYTKEVIDSYMQDLSEEERQKVKNYREEYDMESGLAVAFARYTMTKVVDKINKTVDREEDLESFDGKKAVEETRMELFETAKEQLAGFLKSFGVI